MSNVEIEYKYNVKDPRKLRESMDLLKMKFVAKSRVIDTYFLVPNNPEGRKYFRIREKDGKNEISYSYVESDSHTHEWETAVKDAQMAQEIFKQLDFKIDVTI